MFNSHKDLTMKKVFCILTMVLAITACDGNSRDNLKISDEIAIAAKDAAVNAIKNKAREKINDITNKTGLNTNSITCKIVGVSDGDTATCLDNGQRQIKIRFAGIDAPEKRQEFGEKSKQALSNMIYSKTVQLNIENTDRYGRTVATVYVGDTNVNEQMVRDGMAWAYREYGGDKYAEYEAQARKDKLGLWAHPNPIYPSDFRKAKRSRT